MSISVAVAGGGTNVVSLAAALYAVALWGMT